MPIFTKKKLFRKKSYNTIPFVLQRKENRCISMYICTLTHGRGLRGYTQITTMPASGEGWAVRLRMGKGIFSVMLYSEPSSVLYY